MKAAKLLAKAAKLGGKAAFKKAAAGGRFLTTAVL